MSNENKAAVEPLRLIRIGEVVARTSVSRPTIYRGMAKDEFPKAIKIGSASFWVAGEIDDWIRSHIAASRGMGAVA
jgi:prophage regulatory protein